MTIETMLYKRYKQHFADCTIKAVSRANAVKRLARNVDWEV